MFPIDKLPGLSPECTFFYPCDYVTSNRFLVFIWFSIFPFQGDGFYQNKQLPTSGLEGPQRWESFLILYRIKWVYLYSIDCSLGMVCMLHCLHSKDSHGGNHHLPNPYPVVIEWEHKPFVYTKHQGDLLGVPQLIRYKNQISSQTHSALPVPWMPIEGRV